MKFQFGRFAPVLLGAALGVSLSSVTLPLSPTSALAQASKPATLSFDVAANLRQAGSKSAAQAMNARVHLRGSRARVESTLGDQKLVALLVQPYVYRLLPASKAGVRYKSNTPLPELGAFASNWPQLLSQPQKIRAVLGQKGARRTGTSVLGGTRADVYTASKWNGQARSVKLWIRQSDSLPLRLETTTNGMQLAVIWKNYRRGHALSPGLFEVPKGYNIREGKPPRQLPM